MILENEHDHHASGTWDYITCLGGYGRYEKSVMKQGYGWGALCSPAGYWETRTFFDFSSYNAANLVDIETKLID